MTLMPMTMARGKSGCRYGSYSPVNGTHPSSPYHQYPSRPSTSATMSQQPHSWSAESQKIWREHPGGTHTTGTQGRSATPETTILHHHETQTSGHRNGGKDYREESVEDTPPSLIVTLRIHRDRLRQFMRDQKSRSRPSHLEQASHQRFSSATPGRGTPAAGAMGPLTIPSVQHGRFSTVFVILPASLMLPCQETTASSSITFGSNRRHTHNLPYEL